MREPGTVITHDAAETRCVDGITITETTLRWNDTSKISVDYHAHVGPDGIDMYADSESLTSFDDPLTDEELRTLMREYGVYAQNLLWARAVTAAVLLGRRARRAWRSLAGGTPGPTLARTRERAASAASHGSRE
jgi:hypothetical protein